MYYSFKKDVEYNYIKNEICTYLKFFGNKYNNVKVKGYKVLQAIIYRLKTGCQWRELPLKLFFRVSYRWQGVYYHFQKWSKDRSWEMMWQQLLEKHKSILDLSSIQLDGTQTQSKRGGEVVFYQDRKKCITVTC